MVSLREIFTGGTPRPKTPKYSQVSLAIQAGVSAALASGNVASNLASTKTQIEQILG
jgi:multiple sugar transport system substrate-binding protein